MFLFKKHNLIAFIIAASVSTGPLVAKEGRLAGFGFSAGDPTGISIRFWQIVLHGGYSGLWGFNNLGQRGIVSLDFLFLDFPVDKDEQIYLYLGVGAYGGWYFDYGPHVGARVPVGMQYFFKNLMLEAYAEITPSMGYFIGGDYQFDIQACAGIRYLLF